MRRAAIAFFTLICLAGLWSVAWAVLAREASHRLDGWLADEEAQGRDWTCPDRTIGGYPLAIAVSCRQPTFRGHALGQSVQGGVAGLSAEASLLHPARITVALAPPFTYRGTDGATDVRGQWTELTLDLDGLPDISSVRIVGADVDIAGHFGPGGRHRLGSARLDARFILPSDAADPTVAFDIAVAGTDIPQIDNFFGDTQPLDLHFVGTLDRADVGDARTPEEAIDRWRKAGGRIDIASARAVRGLSTVSGSGTLGLDDAHRPQGRLDTEFVGLQPILKRYGINPDVAAAGAILSSLFGGGRARGPTQPGAIALPVTLTQGRLGIGPIRTDVALDPIY